MNILTRRVWVGKILHNIRLKIQCRRSAIPEAWELTLKFRPMVGYFSYFLSLAERKNIIVPQKIFPVVNVHNQNRKRKVTFVTF